MDFKPNFDELNRDRFDYQQKREKEIEDLYQEQKKELLTQLKVAESQCVNMIKRVYNETGKLPEEPHKSYVCYETIGWSLQKQKNRLEKELSSQYNGGMVVMQHPNRKDSNDVVALIPEYARKQ